jgi:phage-related protein
MKPIRFLGTARRDLAAFLEWARRQAGYELFMVQVGREPADFKPLPTVETGAYELRIRDAAGAFRVVYVPSSRKRFMSCTGFRKAPERRPRRTSSWQRSVTG